MGSLIFFSCLLYLSIRARIKTVAWMSHYPLLGDLVRVGSSQQLFPQVLVEQHPVAAAPVLRQPGRRPFCDAALHVS